MKGLLIKDFQLLKKQKQLFGVSIIISLIFLFSNDNTMFTVGYMTIMFSFASTSTISYDQHANGMGFLLTLPVSRSSYAKEKYVLMLLITGVSLIAALVLVSVGICTKRIPAEPKILQSTLLMCVFWAIVVHSFMIPLLLKFEAEKSRTVTVIVMGIAYGLGFGLVYLIRYFNIDTSAILQQIHARAGTAGIGLILCAAMAVMMGISFLVSLQVMKKKEF